MCVLGGEPPQLSSCKQNMHSTWWVGSGGALVAGTCGDKQTSGCEDHKCAHMYRRVGGMMTNVHVAILSKSLHICENLPPALHVVISVTCVLGGEPPQLSSCKQNMHSTWWVGSGGALVAGTCVMWFDSGSLFLSCELAASIVFRDNVDGVGENISGCVRP